MTMTDDGLRAEIAAHYPDADVEWLLADYRDYCRGCEVGDEPTFRAWLDDQPIAYWDAHGVRHGFGAIMSEIENSTDSVLS